MTSSSWSPKTRTDTALQVITSVMKWCWSRLPGGVVTWEAYELFKVGERGDLDRENAHI